MGDTSPREQLVRDLLAKLAEQQDWIDRVLEDIEFDNKQVIEYLDRVITNPRGALMRARQIKASVEKAKEVLETIR